MSERFLNSLANLGLERLADRAHKRLIVECLYLVDISDFVSSTVRSYFKSNSRLGNALHGLVLDKAPGVVICVGATIAELVRIGKRHGLVLDRI